MDATVLIIFALVYLVMILGGVPGLAIDRTGAALLGAIALMAFDRVTPDEAWRAIDVPTIGLLFGLMIVSAQLRLSGFYSAVTRSIAAVDVSPRVLLALVIAVVGVLSALLTNDIICLAVAPLLIEGCAKRSLNPMPYLLALACAANVGSAATLIGNPQIMLIGQKLELSFAGYLLDAAVPAVLGLGAVWAIIATLYAGRWTFIMPVPAVFDIPLNRWQTRKGVTVILLLTTAFLFPPMWGDTVVTREVLAPTAAGFLLLSRKVHSRDMLSQVDWQLLILFIGLFIVNHALQMPANHMPMNEPMLQQGFDALRSTGINLSQPRWLFVTAAVLSNIVSNVPAVMLLLPAVTRPARDGPILALASTLAGNLFLVGSIANLIVATQASAMGVKITWKEHMKVGVPVTLATLLIAAAWLWIRNL